MLKHAGIPIVLLDRCFEAYPERSNFDLVGIDNHRAGYMLTRHLLQAGAQRIIFVMRPNSASTVDARAAGYRDALYAFQNGASGNVVSGDFEDVTLVKQVLDRFKPDGVVCASDATAARLMQALISLGVRIPADIKMVGVDDVRYANFLPTPLTTIRQDCNAIGAAAMAAMLDRIQSPNQAVRDVLVTFDLVVRASTGGANRLDG
jgi:DNA-binding LacI/PurR family transcriptional regulator